MNGKRKKRKKKTGRGRVSIDQIDRFDSNPNCQKGKTHFLQEVGISAQPSYWERELILLEIRRKGRTQQSEEDGDRRLPREAPRNC